MSQVSVLVAAISVVGCGSDLATVQGVVQREGSKLAAGKIVFTPVGGGRTAFGEIQSDGTFRLTSERPNDGAAPGNYRVRIIESESTEAGMLRTNHEAPRDRLLEIVPGEINEFTIDIRQQEGWQIQQEN